MMSEMVLERTSNLVMPTHYVELDMDEMSYVDGGGLFGKIFGTIGLVLVGIGTIVGGICAIVAEPTKTVGVIGGVAAITVGIGELCGIAAIWDE